MRSALLVFLAIVFSISAAPAQAEKRVALVIGISRYQRVPPLTNPGRDADAMAALFRKAGFDVVDSERDVGIADLRRTIRQFSDTSRDADIAVVYYAGHGIEVDGINYLIPADARLASDFDVEDETISLDRLLKALDPARHLKLIILDACRDNPFAKTMKRTLASRAIGRGLAEIEPPGPDMLVAFAAKAGAVANDGDGENSPFAAALVKYITEPGLDLRLAFGRVRDDVLKATGNRQEPFLYGSLGGGIVALVPKSGDPDADARIDYELAAQIGTAEAWTFFLAHHGRGLLADFARAQLAKLAATRQQSEAEAKEKRTEQAEPPLKPDAEKLAAVSPGPATPQGAGPAATPTDPSQITRLLQAHLKRLGCNSGSVDGKWDDASRKALALFNKNAHTNLDVRVASLDALDAVRSRTERVCPLVCGSGQRANGDSCVQITCDKGFVLNSSGACERAPEARPKARSAEQHEPPHRLRMAPARGGGKCFSLGGRTYCE